MAENLIVSPLTSLEWSGNGIDVTTIERQLAALWNRLLRDSAQPRPMRTSVFNLVVYTPNAEVASEISRSLDQLSGRRPSRVILLVADRMVGQTAVDAGINVACSPDKAHETQFCHERLTVTAHGRAADHLSSIVIPLLLPELPTYLWWPEQPPFGRRGFHRLLAVADQLVVDSSKFESPGDGFAYIARIGGGKQGVNDFQWGRLTPWREILAQFFDGPTWQPYASAIISLKLTFGGGGAGQSATAGTLLLLGWLACHLGWTPETTLDTLAIRDMGLSVLRGERIVPIDLVFRTCLPQAAGRLMGVELVSQPKGLPPARFVVERLEDMDNVAVHVVVHDRSDVSRVIPLGVKNDVELLADELDLAGHDRLYDQVVDMASRMAGREVWMPS